MKWKFASAVIELHLLGPKLTLFIKNALIMYPYFLIK